MASRLIDFQSNRPIDRAAPPPSPNDANNGLQAAALQAAHAPAQQAAALQSCVVLARVDCDQLLNRVNQKRLDTSQSLCKAFQSKPPLFLPACMTHGHTPPTSHTHVPNQAEAGSPRGRQRMRGRFVSNRRTAAATLATAAALCSSFATGFLQPSRLARAPAAAVRGRAFGGRATQMMVKIEDVLKSPKWPGKQQ